MKSLYSFAFILFFLSSTLFADQENLQVKHNYVAFEVVGIDPSDAASVAWIGARLAIPKREYKLPVILVIHGSGGVDERGALYSSHLNQAGFATLEIDMWAARNIKGGLDRPNHVSKTLPDVYSAIQYLKTVPEVDSNNIGLIGFSWGGVIAMLMAGDSTNNTDSLKALVANYPVCWAYNKVSGYPFSKVGGEKRLLIISGKDDLYDSPQDCSDLLRSLPDSERNKTDILELDNATHAFDLKRSDSNFYDPYAFRGKGGSVPIRYNDNATKRSLNTVKKFFENYVK